ncbi:MAG TPA: UDP-N-acetylenolpyruvoylglucosamine reductase [Cyanobacteria bacterium UBA8803]|nr:UDP-N-acetylenolpyruvoylglucosamine reductase [Cyanobacteria bacterium UBA9273]HBL61506.1 UDP-N-acetylenolpyruvoylglucosamine reductase [Cyanobacteria bacterium UBA8803]
MTLSYDSPRVTSEVSPKQTPCQSQLYLPGTDCLVRSQVPLASLTSFRVGGPAEWYVAPRHLEDLQASFEWADTQGLPLTLLGAGSNLLVSDRGLPGLVIGTRHLRYSHFDLDTGRVTAGAGESIARLAWLAAERGWEGLEWAVGIPGTVGGAVVMNAGAHNSCAADLLVNVQTISSNAKVELLTPQELGFAYRTSILQGGARLVTQATFQLKPGADPKKVRATTAQHLKQRHRSQPYHLPSCGSVFRNPESQAAGWLIEQLGLKGYQIGGAQVAERHANFILNCGGAKASDIFQLIRHVQQQVEQHWSLWLEPEVRILGEFQSV